MSTIPACPLCNETSRMIKPQSLYGHPVCKKCVGKFANRRQFAYMIDLFVFYVLQILGGAVLGVMLALVFDFTDEAVIESAPVTIVMWTFLGILFVLYLAKDGFGGRSLGKMVTGVQVVHEETEEPISFGASLKRNWPLVIPFVPLIIAVSMMSGPRMGDRFAKTRVIWLKYAGHPVFSPRAAALAPEAGFGPERLQLPPTQQTTNPFQAPRQ